MALQYGFFGKIPSVGDFVNRGWSPAACTGLDSLLQDALLELLAGPAGKQGLIEAPYAVLMVKPGLLCTEGLTLTIIPSFDKVMRHFPVCAGVQWNEAVTSEYARWPSLEYANELIRRVRTASLGQEDADTLVSAIEQVGDPRNFPNTFDKLAGDETLPLISSDVALVRVQGPASRLPPSLSSLCALLNQKSDVLGFTIDDRGVAEDFFACRHLNASALASIFDGSWARRGWLSYEFGAHWPMADHAVIEEEDAKTMPRPLPFDALWSATDRGGRDTRS